MQERLPLPPDWIGADKQLSEEEFYALALKSVKRKRGLIHGSFRANGRACAVGAMDDYLRAIGSGSISVMSAYIRSLQEFNDAFPDETPRVRRQKVIDWLTEKIKGIP